MSRILIPIAILAALSATGRAASSLEAGAPPREQPAVSTPAVDADMAAAVARVFGDLVVVERGSGGGAVTADLNGDGSQDLAIVVRPIESALPSINHPLASWRVLDPLAPEPGAGAAGVTDARPRLRSGAARTHMTQFPPPPVERQSAAVGSGELLLAVIHGYGPAGWRNALARQAFLLKQLAGAAKMEPTPLEKLMSAGPGRELSGKALAGSIGGRRGFLYWTGATYAWHDTP